jgi:hypothetical protein
MLLEQTSITSFINKKSKTVEKITLLSTIPLDLVFVVEHFLSFKCASRLISTSRNMNSMVSNDALAKIWFKTMISTNCPSLLCISPPSLTSSKLLIQAYIRCRQRGPIAKQPDVSQVLVDMQFFCFKNNTPENGNTITCSRCTLVNPYNSHTGVCAACSRKIDYTGTGDTVTLFRTTSKINGDGTFAYPPIDQTTYDQIDSNIEGGDEGTSPIFLRACLFDPKTKKTFAAIEATVDDFDGNSMFFNLSMIQYAPVQSHYLMLVNEMSISIGVDFNFDVGSTTSQITLYGEIDDLTTVVAPLYVLSRSVVAQTPALLMPKKGQLPFVSQSALMASGRDALFDLPPPPEPANEAQKIAAAKISLATMVKDTAFVVSVSLANSSSVFYHKKLVATYDGDSSLQFAMPGFDAILKATFDSEKCGRTQLQLLAISSSRNTICQLMDTEFEPDEALWSEYDITSASENRAVNSLVGSVLFNLYEEDQGEFPVRTNSYIENDTLFFSVISCHDGETYPPHFLNAYLQMCLLDGSVDMAECE